MQRRRNELSGTACEQVDLGAAHRLLGLDSRHLAADFTLTRAIPTTGLRGLRS